MQQYLPFTVLKLEIPLGLMGAGFTVATVLTVYGIETQEKTPQKFLSFSELQQYLPFTVLKQPEI